MPPKRAGGGQAASAEPPSKRLRSEGRGAGPTARAAAASAAAGGKRGEKPEPATAPRTSKAAAGAKKKPKGKQQEAPGRGGGAADAITINRAPVLTLWAAVVAQRQGHSWEAALTFGHLIAGWLAQSKGRSLGIYEEREKSEEEQAARAARDVRLGVQRIKVFGMTLPAVSVGGELRAVSGGKPVDAASVQAYLQRSFNDRLPDAKAAMEELAAAVPSEEIGRRCYGLYEALRPEWRGWGQKSTLSLQAIRQLAASWQQEA